MSDSLKFLVIITEKRRTNKVLEILAEEGVSFSTALMGHGTAPSEIAELTSLYEAEKTVLLSVLRADKIPPLFEKLKAGAEFGAGGGIAATASINSASSLDAVKFFVDRLFEREENE